MTTMNEKELAQKLSEVLDGLAHGGEGVLITRDQRPVARLVPEPAPMNALEAFSDLFATLPDEEGATWLEDMRGFDQNAAGELKDPWA